MRRTARAIAGERRSARAALNRPTLSPTPATYVPPVAVPTESPREEHPVITSTHPTWFRTVRVVKESDGILIRRVELLAEHRTEAEAIAFSQTEKWRARVTNGRTNKMIYDNWSPWKVE